MHQVLRILEFIVIRNQSSSLNTTKSATVVLNPFHSTKRLRLKEEHPGLYERLILNGTLYRHLADANERAASILDRLIEQMATLNGIRRA